MSAMPTERLTDTGSQGADTGRLVRITRRLRSHADFPPLMGLCRELESTILRKERRVVFVGVLKTGKSTLINALLGAPILPVRANRATGVPVRVGYAERLTATVVRDHGRGTEEARVWPDELARYILLDLTTSIAVPPPRIGEVRIGVPVPALQAGWTLVDTPGLQDTPALTERTLGEIECADLAVLVLAADKLLSESEQAMAHTLNARLRGNVIFVINRLGLVDEKDRSEILQRARDVLGGLGNCLVGNPAIFACDARAALAGAPDPGFRAFERYLGTLLTGAAGERIAVLSRLAWAESRITSAHDAASTALAENEAKRAAVVADEESARDRERRHRRQAIREAHMALRRLRSEIHGLVEPFVDDAARSAVELVDADRAWPKRLTVCFRGPLKAVHDRVTARVAGSLAPLELTAPTLWFAVTAEEAVEHMLDQSRALRESVAAYHVYTGVAAGSGMSATLSRWLCNWLYSPSMSREQLEKAVRQTAEALLPRLVADVRHHLDVVDELLAAAASTDVCHDPSAAVQEATAAVIEAERLVTRIEMLRRAIAEAAREALA